MDNTNVGDEENGGLKVYLFQKFAWARPIIGDLFLIGHDTMPSSTFQQRTLPHCTPWGWLSLYTSRSQLIQVLLDTFQASLHLILSNACEILLSNLHVRKLTSGAVKAS